MLFRMALVELNNQAELLPHFYYFGYLLVDVKLGYPENLSFQAYLEVPCNTIQGGLG